MTKTQDLEEALRLASWMLAKVEKSLPKTISAFRGETFYRDYEPIDPPERTMLEAKVRKWRDDTSELRKLVEFAKDVTQIHGFQTPIADLAVMSAFFYAREMYSQYAEIESRSRTNYYDRVTS